MKYFKSLGVASLAALALMAFVGVGTASASEPVVDATSFPVSFTGTGGAGVLEVTNGNKVSCSGNTASGKISSASTAESIVVKFTGCSFSGIACSTSGAASGEIVTKALHGTLVYLEANSSKTGILLKGEGANELFATFNCGAPPFFGSALTVTGTVLSELTNVNEKTKTFVLHFANDSGHPTPNAYLNPSGCGSVSTTEALKTSATGLVSFGATGSAVQGTATLTTSQEITVTATKCS